MTLQRIRIVAFTWASACGPSAGAGDGGTGDVDSSTNASDTSSSSADATTTSDPTTTTISSTSLDTTGTTGACEMDDDDTFPGGEFDVGPVSPECDLFAQDCDDGEKCIPQGFATRICTPIAIDPIPDGGPCDDGGDDPCGAGSWCGPTDAEGNGTCVPLCTGTPEDPICPPDTICVMDDENVVAFCQRPCDPFADAPCPSTTTCQPTARGFGCIEDGSHLRGDACVQNDSCADGLYCAEAALVGGCCFDRCCTTLCSDEHPCDAGVCHPLPDAVPGPAGLGVCG